MTSPTIIQKGPGLKELPVSGATLPEIFLKQVEKYGATRAAMRYKVGDNWREYSWRDYFHQVEKVTGGLVRLGIGPGDKVCLLSASCPEWLFICLAVQCLGAFLVPIYPNNTPEQVRYIVEHSEAKLLLVQDHGQLAKTDRWRDNLPALKQTIILTGQPPAGVMSFSQISSPAAPGAGFLEKHIRALTPDSPAGIIYTSGTTGPPKGVILTQKNIIFEITSLMTRYDYLYEEDTISFLPLSHIAEQVMTICVGIIAACRVSFARSIETVKDDLLEVRPTLFFSVPRLYEKVYSAILDTVAASPFLRRTIFNWALRTGERARVLRNSGTPLPFFVAGKWKLANHLVFHKLKQKLGLERVKVLASGAAPLSAEVSRFFGAAGMDIFEVFGQTECTGVSNSTLPGRTIPGAIGPAIPGCEVALAGDGEILIRGDNVFSGYWKAPDATAEALRDGWLYTGDIGYFDEEGYLNITDRKKDIIVTAGGKNVAPQNIEKLLKGFPGVSQAVVVGDSRRYLTCLFTLNADTLPKLCSRLGISTLSPRQAAVHTAIINKFREYVDRVNAELASYETIKYFRILDIDFSVESGELTPTLKLKRRLVNEKYKSIIDSMYLSPE